MLQVSPVEVISSPSSACTDLFSVISILQETLTLLSSKNIGYFAEMIHSDHPLRFSNSELCNPKEKLAPKISGSK